MSVWYYFIQYDVASTIALEDGTEFYGRYFTAPNDVFSEVVFNTAMSGYQEVLTDPSYTINADNDVSHDWKLWY